MIIEVPMWLYRILRCFGMWKSKYKARCDGCGRSSMFAHGWEESPGMVHRCPECVVRHVVLNRPQALIRISWN